MIVVEGKQKAIRNLALLGKGANRVIGKSARAGGTVLLKSARQEAPRRNGHFRKSFISVRRTSSGQISYFIGQDRSRVRRKGKGGGISGRGHVVPIHLVDQPTKPHDINVPVAFGGNVYRRVRHPGTHGHNFMVRAANKAERPAANKFFSKMEKEVAAEVAKLSV